MGNVVFHHKNRSKVGRQMGSAWASLVMAFPVRLFHCRFWGKNLFVHQYQAPGRGRGISQHSPNCSEVSQFLGYDTPSPGFPDFVIQNLLGNSQQ